MGVFAGRAITRGTVAAAKAKESDPTMLTVTDEKKTTKGTTVASVRGHMNQQRLIRYYSASILGATIERTVPRPEP